jgi:hypothetical protein
MALEWLKGVMGESHTPELETAIEKELGKHFVSRVDYNELNGKYRTANAKALDYDSVVKERDTARTDLDTEKAARQKDKLESKIDGALTAAGARNPKAVAALLDLTKVKLNDKGDLEGLKEQLDPLKKSDPWAFQTSSSTKSQAPLGGSSSSKSKETEEDGIERGEGGIDAGDKKMNNFIRNTLKGTGDE